MLAHLLALLHAGPAGGKMMAIFFDPVDWAWIVLGVLLCVRAWRLADEARGVLPPELSAPSRPRRIGARIAWVGTVLFAGTLVAWLGYGRYQASKFLLQPGVDPKREHQALLAFNEGQGHLMRNELAAADRSFTDSLHHWEALTAGRSAPALYKMNLAQTLHRLAWIRWQHGNVDEAEKFYTRTLALGDELRGQPEADEEFQQMLTDARESLSALRNEKRTGFLVEKDKAAIRKYEEAVVKDQKDAPEAPAFTAKPLPDGK
jgi:hypothetical protein